jgi:L-threonylcarbamoyladenylate synthase
MNAVLAALRKPGGIILYPTETLYGFGGRVGDLQAALRIGKLKGRGLQPLIVLIDSKPLGMPPLAEAIAERFWPGPVTLVVPARAGFLSEIQGPGETIALRWSPHPVVSELVRAVGPITSTSANKSGDLPLLNLENHAFPVDAVLDVGQIDPSPPSTIVHYSGRLLRRGALADEVSEFISGWLADDSSTA